MNNMNERLSRKSKQENSQNQQQLHLKDSDSLMRVLGLSTQSVVEALAGAALQPRLRCLLVSMETIQSGLKT